MPPLRMAVAHYHPITSIGPGEKLGVFMIEFGSFGTTCDQAMITIGLEG